MHNRCHDDDQHDQTISKKFEEITVWKAEKATNKSTTGQTARPKLKINTSTVYRLRRISAVMCNLSQKTLSGLNKLSSPHMISRRLSYFLRDKYTQL